MPNPAAQDERGPNAFQRTISRRRLFLGSVAAAGTALLSRAGISISQGIDAPVPPPDPTKVQGVLPSELGRRSAFEQIARHVDRPSASGWSLSPLHAMHGAITPADLHFERHHAGVPTIDPRKYSLLIHGMVERPLKFTLEDLKRFPSHSQICFIECSGNGWRGFGGTATDLTPQMIDGLVSTSEWTGVKLATLFKETGVRREARWFLAEGMDAARMTRSIPLEKAWDDAMIAYAQNGEAIRPEQGYPARLLLPGWEGNAQVKWLRRIELADQPFMTREETSKYTDPLGNGTARIFSFVMDAKSIITFPAYPAELTGPGWWQIRGVAWSGRGRITRVDVSTDGGRSWTEAKLEEPVLPKCQVRFNVPWRWDGREALLMSRAVDETGYVQPTTNQLREARGAGTTYHTNNIRVWKVQTNGRVLFARET